MKPSQFSNIKLEQSFLNQFKQNNVYFTILNFPISDIVNYHILTIQEIWFNLRKHLQIHMVAHKRYTKKKHDPVACHKKQNAEQSLQKKLRLNPKIDARWRFKRIYIIRLQVQQA